MSELRLILFGPTRIRLGDGESTPPPLTAGVLARLVVAEGGPVTVDELFRDVWRCGEAGPVGRPERVSVQKRVLELRRLLEPDRPPDRPGVLVTERGRVTSYRLLLRPHQCDLSEFADRVESARSRPPVDAVELLEQALHQWAGRPLFDVEDRPFAAAGIRRLAALRRVARLELMRCHAAIGRLRQALELGERLVDDFPEDIGLGRDVEALRELTRAPVDAILTRAFPRHRTTVVLTVGDLFAQRDAHLVVGFCDTFDTMTDHDLVISSRSVQGRLVHGLYDGDRARLDAALRGALRRVEPLLVERRADKRLGKLTRYPLGTVLALRQDGRRVFAVAYSRMGNDLVARSDKARLSLSLDRLWQAVRLHGQRRPLAIPLVGTGLARIDHTSPHDLLALIVDSFLVAHSREPVAPELRVVVWPADLTEIDPTEVGELLRARSDAARIAQP